VGGLDQAQGNARHHLFHKPFLWARSIVYAAISVTSAEANLKRLFDGRCHRLPMRVHFGMASDDMPVPCPLVGHNQPSQRIADFRVWHRPLLNSSSTWSQCSTNCRSWGE
jgi:hypothetical protein